MLSILIPVHNYDIVPLVTLLDKQLILLEIPYEIFCLDDNSTQEEISKENRKIEKLDHCFYEILSENIGRSRIRNLLVEKSKYNLLIFLDADVIPVKKNFIENYLSSLEKNTIIFGGISYPEEDKYLYKNSLHYKYGKLREAESFIQRTKNTSNFTSANFAIKKSVFEKVKFDETINTYGYEDLIFSRELLLKKYTIKQIDNSVIHKGIVEDNLKYLLKEQESLETLYKLYANNKIGQENIKLLRYFFQLKRLKAIGLYRLFFKLFKPSFLKNLTSTKPSLFIFDLYRLGYFVSLNT